MQFECIYEKSDGATTRKTIDAFSADELLKKSQQKTPGGALRREIRYKREVIWAAGRWKGQRYQAIFQLLEFVAFYEKPNGSQSDLPTKLVRANNRGVLLKLAKAQRPSGYRLATIKFARALVWDGNWKNTTMFKQ